MGVGSDRGQGHGAEVVVDVEVAQVEIVRIGLRNLGELLAGPEGHAGPGGGVGIGQDVEGIDAVPAIHGDALIDEAGSDAQAIAGSEEEGDPPALPVPAVDVLPHAQVGLHGVDEAPQPVVVGQRAHGCGIAQFQVAAQLEVSPEVTAAQGVAPELREPFVAGDLRLVGDVAEGSRLGAGAEERALGPAQDLDPIHVEKIDIRGKEGEGNHGFVQVGAHLLLDPRLVARNLPGRYAAHRDLALAGAQVLDGEPGHVGGQGLDAVDAALSQRFLVGGGHGEGCILDALLSLHGRDRDLLLELGLEGEVCGHRRAAVDLQVLAGLFAEPFEGHGHGVDAGRQADRVAAVGGRGYGLRGAGGLVDGCDCRPGNGAAAGVAHGSANAPRGLGESGQGRKGGEKGERRHPHP